MDGLTLKLKKEAPIRGAGNYLRSGSGMVNGCSPLKPICCREGCQSP